MQGFRIRWLVIVAVAPLWACSAENTETVEVAGDCATAHQAQLCTWATMQGTEVTEIGATVPLASIENAPMEVPMAWPPAAVASVRLPDAARQATGFTHLTMYWEPTGHAPATFMVPHFDFHFYTISPEDRMAIDCADVSKPSALPDAYVLPDEVLPEEVAAMIGVSTLVGVCVPGMGMHALVASEMASETPFSGTMVIGYYRGQNIFVEPMLTRAKLIERRSFDLAIPTIPGRAGTQPVSFRAEYMADQDAYRFVFPIPPAS